MYIKRLEGWWQTDWEECLEYNNVDLLYLDSIKVILTSETKQEIIDNIIWLQKFWIINRIWASWMWKYVVGMITSIFKGVRFELHDINYFLWGTSRDKLDCDYGLFKYSIISIIENYKKINMLDVNLIVKELILLVYTPFALVKWLIILIFWRILVYFGGKAFRFTY